ncbi:hypothetical protein CDL12_17313 [Handroanthus impetiginosus]|uniref:EF-hand domain-containing protein n=1 Tax=Handroanthus impetiginosus TaxID=429701 RepID=A0A2G9GXT1_9LAMI|nr:hypothetical protein CDL12_17313 [Handroanthus impetiginosus]
MALMSGGNAGCSRQGNAGKNEMTAEEFKTWLMKFDADKDGRISKKELRRAIRSCSRRFSFSAWKSRRAMREADVDKSGYIDEEEIDFLLDFAETNLGFRICY